MKAASDNINNDTNSANESFLAFLERFTHSVEEIIFSTDFLLQLVVILAIYTFSYFFSIQVRSRFLALKKDKKGHWRLFNNLREKVAPLTFPLFALFFLKLTEALGEEYLINAWILRIAIVVAALLLLNRIIEAFVESKNIERFMRWVLLPIVFLHLIGVLPSLIAALQSFELNVGNVEVSMYGVARVIIFGVILFWLGRLSRNAGKELIHNHERLDVTTKEVFTKLFEVFLFCIFFLLLLNVMGIDLTALAVFSGALGVGLGLGLQSIASNFISGIIILLDRSLTIGDFVELEDGSKGFVREFRMRYTVLETYDGKDIIVPNEKFINSLMTNWTHKDPKQRYRIDFSVAYKTDIRELCDIIKQAVAAHPQVISGEDIPFEERPDCEIDSFGDSGVNMFVEFWMLGIDDGKNRVGGDLLLIVFETLREHNIEIPFPQREVRVLDNSST